jgi:patatin-related protein
MSEPNLAAVSPPTPQPTKLEYEQEVRLAVVMYGGVSLAIYINGVAQELLHLVRATAPKRSPAEAEPLLRDDELSEVEQVYRELGCRVGFGTNLEPDLAGPPKIRTRFVVDVLSGTSAGGINAVFLAKALARHQTMDQLKKLWIIEGDLGRLLNDKVSVGDLERRVEHQKPPLSFLNSRRMYLKLLDALRGMEASQGELGGGPSPLADELDLFVTATDLYGLVVRLRLADQIVYERRYRNVFHFHYAVDDSADPDSNEFAQENDPFLAFAARCTSSFPVAFEPMTLEQIREVAGAVADEEAFAKSLKRWKVFFPDYVPASGTPERDEDPSIDPLKRSPSVTRGHVGPFKLRPFADGGYLDNKPFGHAISALRQRRSDVLVTRRLFYIEPSPEHPELDRLPAADSRGRRRSVRTSNGCSSAIG